MVVGNIQIVFSCCFLALFERILQQLRSQRTIWIEDENDEVILFKRVKSREYFLDNISMIPDEKTYPAVDISSRKKVGILDENFVLSSGFEGEKFILRGRPWVIVKKEEDKLIVMQDFIEKKLRIWTVELLQKLRKALISKINTFASEIYRNIREEDDAVLRWNGDDYDIDIKTSNSSKSFYRLSGGERMAAALSVRLAILKAMTNVEFAFFDEPTTNLDPTTRNNLGKHIANLKGFKQLFVISHDDAFKRNSDYVINFTKDATETTKVEYLTKTTQKT